MIAQRRPFLIGDEQVTFRPEDEAECRASDSEGCASSVVAAHRSGGDVEVLLSPRSGLPFCFFGMQPVDEHLGVVWMLATPEIERNARSVAHWTPQVLRGWHARCPLIFNVVDARNELHIRWLKRLGFTFIALHPHYGIEQRPFYEFVRLAHV